MILSALCRKRTLRTWHGATLLSAEIKRSNSVIETINPVFIILFGMFVHPSNDLLRDIVRRQMHDAFVYKASLCQEFGIGKNRVLAGLGSCLTVRQEFRG